MRLGFYSINTNEQNNKKTFSLHIVPFKTKNGFVSLLFIFIWLFGIVLAKGFWSTLLAFILPLWGYYLIVETLVYKFLM